MARDNMPDALQKKIVADYIELQSFRAVAKRNNVSPPTVKRYVERNQDVAEIIEAKHEQNTVELLQHIEDTADKNVEIIDKLRDTLLKKLESGDLRNLQAISVSYGIFVDKSLAIKELKHKLAGGSEPNIIIAGIVEAQESYVKAVLDNPAKTRNIEDWE